MDQIQFLEAVYVNKEINGTDKLSSGYSFYSDSSSYSLIDYSYFVYSLGSITAKYIGHTKYYNIPARALKKLNTAKILFKNIENSIDITIYNKLNPILAVINIFLDFSFAFVNFNSD